MVLIMKTRRVVVQLLEEYFRIMSEVGNDDVVQALEARATCPCRALLFSLPFFLSLLLFHAVAGSSASGMWRSRRAAAPATHDSRARPTWCLCVSNEEDDETPCVTLRDTTTTTTTVRPSVRPSVRRSHAPR